ncbi:low molecular weight protein tyrosine phosphatase family protein [Hymenobacter fodinae]|uniref:Phosphotyrosine protein phosphatase n=1 Tax=Hymenobacter fodinae TaxID=2510796 RepID=A0A4Z0PDF2_9BACT|nr:phosphotyrosine protein phosphatase [Hymenobacter fodinae]TGE10303.1 phosphotyrosine protein phosphatase [Hymenobacter fodinae]
MSASTLKLLFVCTINRMRSATAQKLYQEDPRFEVKSAGTAASALQVLSTELLDWADTVIVMEKGHRNFIRKHFPLVYQQKRIVCLYIPDEYDFMQPTLQYLLREKVEDVYRRGLLG